MMIDREHEMINSIIWISDDKVLYVPSLYEYRAMNNEISHKKTIAFSNSRYIFEMDTFSYIAQ